MKYAEIRKVNVNEHIEQKNGLNYLSWAWAVDKLLELDSTATWSYGEPIKFGETLMVFCTVEAFGKKMTAQLPVMNFRNQAIANPDAMSVNTAMQRCLAKAIALHGLGLYIYTGEDLKDNEDAVKKPSVVEPPKQSIIPTAGAMDNMDEEQKLFIDDCAKNITAHFEANDNFNMLQDYNSLDNEEKVAVWSLLGSKVRSTIKKMKEQ
jgi:Protein of unknown function (DUF1071)